MSKKVLKGWCARTDDAGLLDSSGYGQVTIAGIRTNKKAFGHYPRCERPPKRVTITIEVED